MKLILNGERYESATAESVRSLLQEIGMEGRRVAVLVNDEVIPSEARPSRTLSDGDRVDVVTFVGGG